MQKLIEKHVGWSFIMKFQHYFHVQNCEICHWKHNRGEDLETSREEGTGIW